ncbi:MAG: hypothetical protein ABFD61_05075 [Chloroherpetonaceae bacterium]
MEWYYCQNNGDIDDHCIEKMRITFENGSDYHISSITIMLEIKSYDGLTLYKKRHTVSVDLDPREILPCNEFFLKERLYSYATGYLFSDADEFMKNIDIQILSAK